jgi:hypothetical protein
MLTLAMCSCQLCSTINVLSTEFLPYRLPLSSQQYWMIHYTVLRQAGVSANLVHACLLLQACSLRRNLKTPYNASRPTPIWNGKGKITPKQAYAALRGPGG